MNAGFNKINQDLLALRTYTDNCFGKVIEDISIKLNNLEHTGFGKLTNL